LAGQPAGMAQRRGAVLVLARGRRRHGHVGPDEPPGAPVDSSRSNAADNPRPNRCTPLTRTGPLARRPHSLNVPSGEAGLIAGAATAVAAQQAEATNKLVRGRSGFTTAGMSPLTEHFSETHDLYVHYVHAEAVRWVDLEWPGWIEVHLREADGTVASLVDKAAIFDDADRRAHLRSRHGRSERGSWQVLLGGFALARPATPPICSFRSLVSHLPRPTPAASGSTRTPAAATPRSQVSATGRGITASSMPMTAPEPASTTEISTRRYRMARVEGMGCLPMGVVGGGEVVVEVGVAELVDRADCAEQAEAVGVIQERHQVSG
jgi:hypothetical protein